MKKYIIKPLLLLLLLSCIFVLAACGNKVDNIAISDSGKPRLTYVQGQDLDLSVGTLTVIKGSDTSTLPLTAEGISFSGYDKNQLGKQTVTVSYQGKTATFEVTVVARMTVSEQETNYFVGDLFDASKGRVKINKDDGTYTNVNLDSSEITVTGFDTSKAGTVNVAVSYTDNGVTYQTTFPVTVHEVGELTFSRPSKTAYQSHEKELVLTGGYFTVTAADDPSFSKYVDITADMVTGYDPSKATKEYENQALKQMIQVSYAGRTFEYEVSVLYGPITFIYDAVELLKDLDWSQDVTLTDEQGMAAYQAISKYMSLISSDQAMITAEMLQIIVPPAAQYVGLLFLQEAENYSQSFGVSDAGNLLFRGESYEQMGIDQVNLDNPYSQFNLYAELLRDMESTFEKMEVREDLTIADMIKVPSHEEIDFYAGLFAFLRNLHECMLPVPTNWKLEELSNYAENIITAVYVIQMSPMIGPDYSYVFDALAKWRDNDDFFEIIYSYFCYIEPDGHEFVRTNLWQKLPLPGDMQDWYLNFYRAVVEAQYMYNNGDGDAYLRDTSTFMYYYFEAMRLAEEIKNCDNQLYKDIYDIIDGDLYITQNIVLPTGGYVSHANGLVDSAAYVELWNQYMKVFRYYLDGSYDAAIHGADVEALFRGFTNLGATEMYQFLCSLQFNYGETVGSYHALDFSTQAGNVFVAILANYYMSQLPEGAGNIFRELLLAMENYAIYAGNNTYTKGLEAFKQGMAGIATAMAALNAEDRAAVEALVGNCYTKYQKIYNAVINPKDFSFDLATQSKLDQFYQTLQTYYAIADYMNQNAGDQMEMRYTTIQLFAAYEKAKRLYTELVNLGNEDLMVLLNVKKYNTAGTEMTLDMAFCLARNNFVFYMFYGMAFDQRDENGKVVATVPAWDFYHGTEIPGFLYEAADLLLAGFNGTVQQLDKAYVQRVAAALRALDEDNFFLLYGIGIAKYLDCMAAYYRANITDEETKELAIAILNSEFGYVVYHALGHQDKEMTYFKTQFEDAKAKYESLKDTSIFEEYLKEIYEFYEAFYNSHK